MKLFKLMPALLLATLTACNNANFSYPVEKFYSIDAATFSELSAQTEEGTGKRIRGPQIAYSLRTYGGLSASKNVKDDVKYTFFARVEYTDYGVRKYDTVLDAVTGTRLPSTYTGGREGNGGYRAEFVNVSLTAAMIEEAKSQGFVFVIIAPTCNGNARTGVGIANSEIVIKDFQDNCDYRMKVPAKYVREFAKIVR